MPECADINSVKRKMQHFEENVAFFFLLLQYSKQTELFQHFLKFLTNFAIAIAFCRTVV